MGGANNPYTLNMAEKYEEMLACEICSETYTDPLMLPCLHSFCKKCLIKVQEEQGASNGSLKCPTCDTSVPLPDGKIEGLSQNSWLAHQVKVATVKDKLSSGKDVACDDCFDDSPAVSHCSECGIFLCSLCQKNHQRRRETGHHKLTEVGKKAVDTMPHISHRPMYCSKHTDEKLKFYCHTCQVLACRDCILVVHKDHQFDDNATVVSSSKQKLRQCVTNCDKVLDAVNDVIANGEKMLQQIEKREEEVVKEIKEVFSVLQAALESRCKVLIAKSEEIADDKKETVKNQLKAFQKLKTEVCYANQLAVAVVESDDPGEEILSIDKLITDQLKRCIEVFQESSSEIAENEKIFAYLDVRSLSNDISRFGGVSAIDPSSCSIDTGLAVPLATVGKERRFTAIVVDDAGRATNCANVVDASFVSVDGNGEEEKVTVVNNNNSITVSCIPQRVGQFELSLKVGGQQMKGSPYRLSVKQKRDYSSIQNQCVYNVGSSTFGVAIDAKGDVYASNSGNGFIQVFNKNGAPIHIVGSKGTGNGQFTHPYGLVLVGDTLYVADFGLHRVQMFLASTGEHIGQFGSVGSGQGQFSHPWGISYNGKDRILVADCNNKRVQVFSMDGAFVHVIDCGGNQPYLIAVDNDGNIHVTYHSQHIVQVFSSDGTKIRSYNNPNGNFQYPRGIAIDDEGYCFITAAYGNNYYLHVLDPTGKQVNLISGFNNPWGVALDKEGYIYVADYGNGRIMKY